MLLRIRLFSDRMQGRAHFVMRAMASIQTLKGRAHIPLRSARRTGHRAGQLRVRGSRNQARPAFEISRGVIPRPKPKAAPAFRELAAAWQSNHAELNRWESVSQPRMDWKASPRFALWRKLRQAQFADREGVQSTVVLGSLYKLPHHRAFRPEFC